MGKIYVVGLGPGDENMMTAQAREALEESDTIVGYKTYTALIRDAFPYKEFIENGMRKEAERCENCIALAQEGRTVALVCSGDAGVYGMASLMLEIADREDFTAVEVIPGVTAALSGAALLGAPLGHDFCVISLSDLLTPWVVIEKRLRFAAEADFCMALYNPGSSRRTEHLKRACEILLQVLPEQTACGYVRNIGRDGCEQEVCILKELSCIQADMFMTVFIGNSATRILGGRLVTPRGYLL